jgi:hypothetical protein
VLAAIAVAAQHRRAVPAEAARKIGWVLIAVPLPVAVLIHLTLLHSGRADQTLFIGGAAAFAVGAALVLGREEDDDGLSVDDPDPSWWPEFERAFRDYSRRRPPSRPRVRI